MKQYSSLYLHYAQKWAAGCDGSEERWQPAARSVEWFVLKNFKSKLKDLKFL